MRNMMRLWLIALPFMPAWLPAAQEECFRLSLVHGKEPPIPLERLLLDRRTSKTLPEEGFRFVGSVMLPALNDPGKKAYGADAYQPMAIVSLFNSTCTVLEFPRKVSKGVTPDRGLLDRDGRKFHPWELALLQKDGAVSGTLLRIDSIYRTGFIKSELEVVELPVSSP